MSEKAEYYVMQRVRGERNPDKLIRTCETSLQAWSHINKMPSETERSKHYVKFNAEAIRLYEMDRDERGMG